MTVNTSYPCQRQRFRGFPNAGVYLTVDVDAERERPMAKTALDQFVDKLLETPKPQSSPWPCRKCGRPTEIEAVEPSLDGQRVLTYWHCEPCQIWAVTPDTLRQPPVWV